MLLRLLLLFTLLPLVELGLLLWIADHTSWQFTLALVILTGVAGAWLARQQGLRCWSEVNRRLSRGELPADSLLDALMILVAGAVLITPGVLTDLAGFALLIAPVRRLVRRRLARSIQARIVVGPVSGTADPFAEHEDVIDVEHRDPDDPAT